MSPPPPRSTPFPYTTLFRSWRSAAERGLDQLERVRARPLGRSGQHAEFAAIAVHQQRGRHAERLSHRLEILERLGDRKSTRLNSSHVRISYAVFCLKKKNKN